MIKIELLERNKNKILNFGIILLALFIAFQIYKSADVRINTLTSRKDDELKKNRVIENIAALEKKIEGYKKVFAKKDMSSIVEAISNIAKNSSVNIVSIKPITEEAVAGYVKSSFLMTVSSLGYHSLANFISQIESNKDIYMVDEVNINSADFTASKEGINTNLSVNLKISTISY